MTSLIDQIETAMLLNQQGIQRSSLPEKVTGQSDAVMQGVIETLLLLKGGYHLDGDRWSGQARPLCGRVLEMLDNYVATKSAPIFRLSEALKGLDPSEQMTDEQLKNLISRERPRFHLLPNGMIRYTKE